MRFHADALLLLWLRRGDLSGLLLSERLLNLTQRASAQHYRSLDYGFETGDYQPFWVFYNPETVEKVDASAGAASSEQPSGSSDVYIRNFDYYGHCIWRKRSNSTARHFRLRCGVQVGGCHRRVTMKTPSKGVSVFPKQVSNCVPAGQTSSAQVLGIHRCL